MNLGLQPSAAEQALQPPLILFLHIPKTAGSTVDVVMYREYGEDGIFWCHPDPNMVGQTPADFNKLPEHRRQRYRVVKGHFPFGLHREIKTPSTYITILRDPVERIISHYAYVKERTDHYLHQRVQAEHLSLRDYVQHELSVELDNGQTRMLVGDRGWEPKFGQCPDEFLDIAKQNLHAHFAAVGTTERFDELLLLLKELLGWSLPLYERRKVSQNRLTRDRISADTLTAIQAVNQLDQQLYNYASQRLDELIQEHIRFFPVKRTAFKVLNRLYINWVSRGRPSARLLQALKGQRRLPLSK